MCSDKGFNVNMLGQDSVSCRGLTRMDLYYAVEMDSQSPCIETAGISCNGVGGLRSIALHCRIDAFRKEMYVIDQEKGWICGELYVYSPDRLSDIARRVVG